MPLAPAYRQNMLWMHNKRFYMPGTDTMPALKPDFQDLGPGRLLISDSDPLMYMPDQWDLLD